MKFGIITHGFDIVVLVFVRTIHTTTFEYAWRCYRHDHHIKFVVFPYVTIYKHTPFPKYLTILGQLLNRLEVNCIARLATRGRTQRSLQPRDPVIATITNILTPEITMRVVLVFYASTRIGLPDPNRTINTTGSPTANARIQARRSTQRIHNNNIELSDFEPDDQHHGINNQMINATINTMGSPIEGSICHRTLRLRTTRSSCSRIVSDFLLHAWDLLSPFWIELNTWTNKTRRIAIWLLLHGWIHYTPHPIDIQPWKQIMEKVIFILNESFSNTCPQLVPAIGTNAHIAMSALEIIRITADAKFRTFGAEKSFLVADLFRKYFISVTTNARRTFHLRTFHVEAVLHHFSTSKHVCITEYTFSKQRVSTFFGIYIMCCTLYIHCT